MRAGLEVRALVALGAMGLVAAGVESLGVELFSAKAPR